MRLYICLTFRVPSVAYFESKSFINHWTLMDMLSLLKFKLDPFFKTLG